MRCMAVSNQKGGVGKSTTVANLGAAWARVGKRVLAIDLDPQSNLTSHLGFQPGDLTETIYDVLLRQRPIAQAIRPTKQAGFDLVPTNINLAGAEVELVGMVARETLLREALSQLPKDSYDLVLIDCPPSLGLLTLNAMSASDEVLIPVQVEYFALQGLSRLVDTIELVRRKINAKLELRGVIACLYDSRRNLSKEVLANLKEYFGNRVFKTLVRENVSLAEAPSHGQTIFDYAPRSSGALDYQELAQEVLAHVTI